MRHHHSESRGAEQLQGENLFVCLITDLQWNPQTARHSALLSYSFWFLFLPQQHKHHTV